MVLLFISKNADQLLGPYVQTSLLEVMHVTRVLCLSVLDSEYAFRSRSPRVYILTLCLICTLHMNLRCPSLHLSSGSTCSHPAIPCTVDMVPFDDIAGFLAIRPNEGWEGTVKPTHVNLNLQWHNCLYIFVRNQYTLIRHVFGLHSLLESQRIALFFAGHSSDSSLDPSELSICSTESASAPVDPRINLVILASPQAFYHDHSQGRSSIYVSIPASRASALCKS